MNLSVFCVALKVVSVSRTPGHTKHFQTIFLTRNVRLCDSPGLVFPSVVARPLQVCSTNTQHNNNNNRFMAFCPGLPGWAGTRRNSPTHHPDHHPVFISFFHLPWSIASSLFKLRGWQSFCTTSFYVLFGLPLGLEPSTSYYIHLFLFFLYYATRYVIHWSILFCKQNSLWTISSPNHCLLFATHAHTIATCFAVVSILYNLFLVFLSAAYLELYLLP